MARLTAVSSGIDQIKALADDLGGASPAEFARAAVIALNETVDRTYDLARDRITEGINLSDEYLRARMRVRHATPATPQAEILAPGDRSALTRLVHYDAQMQIVPRDTAGRDRNRGRLGIPKGAKQQGVNVTVIRGSEKTLDSGFMLRLRAGNAQGDNYGVFMRDGKKIKQLFGPSVYQLFAWQAPRLVGAVTDDLEKTLIDRVAEQMKGVLK